MHWIVNTNLRREGGYAALLEQLERQQQPYTLVRKPPFVDYLVAMEDEGDDAGSRTPIMIEIEGPVFVAGTTSMKAVSQAHGWSPGYIDAPSQQECFRAWGEHMLNIDAQFGAFRDVTPPSGDFFIRPNLDNKAFSGTVMQASRFESWREGLLKTDVWATVPPDLEVMVAPLRSIHAEYRCIIVNGRYVTGSRYKSGRAVTYSPEVDQRIICFANERVGEWNPRPALCLDIADTGDGLRILETNAISSSAFYAIDMNLFVGEISGLAE